MTERRQVFYRKWRPTRFDEVVGQQHVTGTLKRAVATGRVAHAYLFTGPRGVGKTSTARILAKALNAGTTDDGEPINDSEVARAIDEGRYMDLIEIDAASNRGIGDIRELRDNVQFQPIAGGWKVYIIDEVHMLTEPAFNALLKTLEEPPPNVVMILATTDVHKVPATIVSRCQRYDFRRLSNDDVIDRLIELCEKEEIECEPEVLEIVARAAWGSLRDAENLLEQLSVSYGGEITGDQARELLGLGDTGPAIELATAILDGDAGVALRVVNREAARGADLRALRNGVIDALRVALLRRSGVEDALSESSAMAEAMQVAARSVKLEHLLNALSMLGQADVKSDSSSPLPLELSVLRAASGPVQAAAPAQHAAAVTEPAGRYAQQPAAAPRGPAPPSSTPRPEPPAQPERGPRRERSPGEERWNRVIWDLRRAKFRRWVLGSILRNVDTPEPEEGKLALRFKSRNLRDRFMEEFEDARAREALKKAITSAYGEELRLEVHSPFEQAGSNGPNGSEQPASKESPLVRAAMAMGATIVGEEDVSDIDEGEGEA